MRTYIAAALLGGLLALGCNRQADPPPKAAGVNSPTTPGQPGPPGTRTEQPASPDTGKTPTEKGGS